MNRKLIFTAILLFLILLLFNKGKTNYMYSNLADSASQNLLVELLPEDLSPADRQLFWESVTHYNELMLPHYLIKRTMNQSPIDYKATKLMDAWHNETTTFYDLNSKLNAFRLFNTYLSVNQTNALSINQFDLDTIRTNPYANLSQQQLQLFMALYAPIHVSSTESATIVNEINSEWNRRTLFFHPPTHLSLINLFTIDSIKESATVIQAGLLLSKGKHYYYLEKYAPIFPYQLLKFNHKMELIDYLNARLPLDQTVIILENQEMLTS